MFLQLHDKGLFNSYFLYKYFSMKFCVSSIIFALLLQSSGGLFAQAITYSEVEKADSRNMNFEILGNFSNNFLIYKNLNKRQNLTLYDDNMFIKESIDLDFISDRTYNIDFVTYPDHFLIGLAI